MSLDGSSMKSPDSMSGIIGNVLRYGVILSAAIISLGLVLLASASGNSEVGTFLTYSPDRIPHGTFDTSLGGLLSGLVALQPFSVIELGTIVLIATPVVRVLTSVFLYAAQKDRLYVVITAAVLALLVFSIFVTPFIPLFQG